MKYRENQFLSFLVVFFVIIFIALTDSEDIHDVHAIVMYLLNQISVAEQNAEVAKSSLLSIPAPINVHTIIP